MMNKRELELYLHIPFCIQKCQYCDFLSFPESERNYQSYVNQLVEEIKAQGTCFGEYHVTTIFVGGGTPSVLFAEQMEQLFQAIYESFYVDETCEITVEVNPGTVDLEKLMVYHQCGINRLSLGLQSADDDELKHLGRIHTYDSFLKSYERARQAGFANINVDLMSALPGQTTATWKNTLKKVIMLKPEHISAYSLIIEEGTPFYKLYGEEQNTSLSEALSLPDEDVDREMYHLTKELMEQNGYNRYEISNYAKEGCACRHNIGYWTGVEYLGLGLGASSYTHGCRYKNTSDYQEYLTLDFTKPGAAAGDIEHLSRNERIEEFMILGLRMMEGVSGGVFYDRFGQSMWQIYGDVIEKLIHQGLLEGKKPDIKLTEWGIDVSNQVLAEFLLSGR